MFVGVFFTGGKKWDAGDNQATGHKDYHTRKAEELEAKRIAEKKAEKEARKKKR